MATENKTNRSYNSSKKGPELGKVPEKLIKEQLKLPPQAVETERGLLGVLLTHEHSFDEVCQQLIPEVFYLKIHQYIQRDVQNDAGITELETEQILDHGKDTVQTCRGKIVGKNEQLIVQRQYQSQQNNDQV